MPNLNKCISFSISKTAHFLNVAIRVAFKRLAVLKKIYLSA